MSDFLEELKSEQHINAIVHSAVPHAMKVKDVADATKIDTELQTLIRWIQSDEKIRTPKLIEPYKNVLNELSVSSDGIVLRGKNIVIPASLRERILDLVHAGHQGIVKTKALIRAHVWYPGIDNQVEKRVQTCRACQSNVDKPSFEPMKPSKMPEGPWRNISGDFFGPMADGTYYFVNHDDYSRWASVETTKSVSMDDAEKVLEQLFTTFGAPLVYKSDNGSPFQSVRFAAFAKKWGFTHQKITPLWPRANASAESFMKKLGKVIRTAEVSGPSKKEALKAFLRVYRDTPHSTTKVAPAMLLMGLSRHSGLPRQELPFTDLGPLSELHSKAQLNDKLAKERI